jgi:hypothetical protein
MKRRGREKAETRYLPPSGLAKLGRKKGNAMRIIEGLVVVMISLQALRAQGATGLDSSHPAVIRSANVPFTPINDDLYQKATDGVNVQSALKDIVARTTPQKLPTGALYVLYLQNAQDHQAKNYCRALTVSGLGGWRLPTDVELEGIFGQWKEAAHANVKGGIQLSGYIWSATSTCGEPGFAKFAYLGGTEYSYYWDKCEVVNKAAHMRALCVRSAR